MSCLWHVGNTIYLCYQFLVLLQPGLSHGSLSVEATRHLFKLFLPDELIPKHPLSLVFSPLQLFPCLVQVIIVRAQYLIFHK